jgi:hypothetical protein
LKHTNKTQEGQAEQTVTGDVFPRGGQRKTKLQRNLEYTNQNEF